MYVKTTKLSKQGQITLPKSFIQELGLITGQLVDLEIKNNTILIKKKSNPLDEFVGVMDKKNPISSEEYIKIRKKNS